MVENKHKKTVIEYVSYETPIQCYVNANFAAGNQKALKIINKINELYGLNSTRVYSLLKMYGIKGDKLERFINSCCNTSVQKFEKTLALLSCNKIAAPVVSKNLNLKLPIPFLPQDALKDFDNVSLNDLLTNSVIRDKLSTEAEDISTKITPIIERKYKEYVESLQRI